MSFGRAVRVWDLDGVVMVLVSDRGKTLHMVLSFAKSFSGKSSKEVIDGWSCVGCPFLPIPPGDGAEVEKTAGEGDIGFTFSFIQLVRWAVEEGMLGGRYVGGDGCVA